MSSMCRDKKGFTLIEILVAFGIVAIIATLSIATINSISKSRVKDAANTIKQELQEVQELGKSHGGDASLIIKKTDTGVDLIRSSLSIKNETKTIKNADLHVYFTRIDDNTTYELGEDADQIQLQFQQTTGSFIGSDLLKTMTLSANETQVTLVFHRQSGLVSYDYESEDLPSNEETLSDVVTTVDIPSIIVNGHDGNNNVSYAYTGESIQPNVSYNNRYVKIGGEYRKTEKGTYQIIWRLKDPSTTTWADGTTSEKYSYWTID